MKTFTTKAGAKALGLKQATLRHYAKKFNVGSHPEGVGTPWLFTRKELLVIRNRAKKGEKVEMRENRRVLRLGAFYDLDTRLRR